MILIIINCSMKCTLSVARVAGTAEIIQFFKISVGFCHFSSSCSLPCTFNFVMGFSSIYVQQPTKLLSRFSWLICKIHKNNKSDNFNFPFLYVWLWEMCHTAIRGKFYLRNLLAGRNRNSFKYYVIL